MSISNSLYKRALIFIAALILTVPVPSLADDAAPDGNIAAKINESTEKDAKKIQAWYGFYSSSNALFLSGWESLGIKNIDWNGDTSLTMYNPSAFISGFCMNLGFSTMTGRLKAQKKHSISGIINLGLMLNTMLLTDVDNTQPLAKLILEGGLHTQLLARWNLTGEAFIDLEHGSKKPRLGALLLNAGIQTDIPLFSIIATEDRYNLPPHTYESRAPIDFGIYVSVSQIIVESGDPITIDVGMLIPLTTYGGENMRLDSNSYIGKLWQLRLGVAYHFGR